MKKIFALYLFLLSSSAMALEVKLSEGQMTLAELLTACSPLANSVSSTTVQKDIPGLKISIHGIPYEVRYFSFEDTAHTLPANMTFKDYVKQNHLMGMKSWVSEPLPGLHFEAFDFRQAKLPDHVYFSMALRELKS